MGCVADVDILDTDPPEVATLASHAGAKNATGYADTFFAGGDHSKTGPFFAALGTNGRSCQSCHVQEEGWSITPAGMKKRFNSSQGNDPIFRSNDGSVSPNADVSTKKAREDAFKLLMSRGLVRVGIGIPAGAEFTLAAVDDPYGFASAAELSLFRRPLPSTSLTFLPTIMWDGREPSLRQQAEDATLGHAQAMGVTGSDMDAIVTYESQLYTAQTTDDAAGAVDANGARGGPQHLANQPFSIGINDVFDPGFDQNAMTLFDAWAPPANPSKKKDAQARYAIYRGQQIFNTKPITITGVGGLNGTLVPATFVGTCTSCHDSPNIGNHSKPLAINIGIADASRRSPDMPLYTLRRNSDGATIQTVDPGRALITGKWDDIGKFKGPILRGLQTRPPYFHDGSAATLRDVINFYNTRFSIGLTTQETADLLAFLQAL